MSLISLCTDRLVTCEQVNSYALYLYIFNLFPHFFTISVGRSSVLHQLAERSSSLFLLVSPGKENKFSNTELAHHADRHEQPTDE